MTQNDPHQLLGILANAGDDEIRAAYLRKVKEFPPDKAPQEFEKIREAYEALRDPRSRMLQMLSVDPNQPLAALLEARLAERRFAGPEPWLAVLKEPKS